MESNWLIFIFGLVVGLYIKAFTHDVVIKAYLRFLFGDEEVNKAAKKYMSENSSKKFDKRIEDLKKAQETKQPK